MSEIIPIVFWRRHMTDRRALARFFPGLRGKPRYLVVGTRERGWVGIYDFMRRVGYTDESRRGSGYWRKGSVRFWFRFFGFTETQFYNFMRRHHLTWLSIYGARRYSERHRTWRFWCDFVGLPPYWLGYPISLVTYARPFIPAKPREIWYHEGGIPDYEASIWLSAKAIMHEFRIRAAFPDALREL